jgi:hypothetical protein
MAGNTAQPQQETQSDADDMRKDDALRSALNWRSSGSRGTPSRANEIPETRAQNPSCALHAFVSPTDSIIRFST